MPGQFPRRRLVCSRSEYGRGAGYPWQFGDPTGLFGSGDPDSGIIRRCEADHGVGNCEKHLAIWYPKCAEGFFPHGCCFCIPYDISCETFGLGGQFFSSATISCAKCSFAGDPVPLRCPNSLEQYGELCYPICAEGYFGVGPACLMTCDTAQFSCFAACAINELLCMWTTNGAATSLLILGFNIATLGMGAPATGAATVAIKTEHGGTRPVSGTTNVGKAMVTLANTMQTTDTKVVAVGKAVYNSRTGELRSNVAPKVATGVSETYKAYQTYRRIAAEDFVKLTSAAINAEIDQHYHPFTANYIKQAWAEVHFRQLAEAYGWVAANNALTETSIVDFSGIAGVLAAYVKPVCRATIDYPCTNIDLSCWLVILSP